MLPWQDHVVVPAAAAASAATAVAVATGNHQRLIEVGRPNTGACPTSSFICCGVGFRAPLRPFRSRSCMIQKAKNIWQIDFPIAFLFQRV